MIGNSPDLFYETCLVGWGATRLKEFDPEMLADYRRCWRDSEMIHGSCSDYRAAATIDLEHDGADLYRKVICPALVLHGAAGTMARCFDIAAEWSKRCADVRAASLPGGHFFVDQFPQETADILASFLSGSRSGPFVSEQAWSIRRSPCVQPSMITKVRLGTCCRLASYRTLCPALGRSACACMQAD